MLKYLNAAMTSIKALELEYPTVNKIPAKCAWG